MLMRTARQLAAQLMPALCPLCHLAGSASRGLCRPCHDALPRLPAHCRWCAEPLPRPGLCPHCLANPPAFDSVASPCLYAPPLDGLVLALKHGDLSAAPALAGLLASHIRERGGTEADVLVPVPLHWRRRLQRGFNQSRELAGELGRELELPLAPGILKRVVDTPAQQGLDRRQRRRNLRRAFTVARPVAGRRIAVVDDVVTTAATSRALARVLLDAGAAGVEIWCVARTPVENR